MLFLFARWFGCRHGTARAARDRREEGGFRLGAPAPASSPISGGDEAEGLGEKSASIAMRIAVSGRLGLAGTRPEGSRRRSISASSFGSRLSGKASVPHKRPTPACCPAPVEFDFRQGRLVAVAHRPRSRAWPSAGRLPKAASPPKPERVSAIATPSILCGPHRRCIVRI